MSEKEKEDVSGTEEEKNDEINPEPSKDHGEEKTLRKCVIWSPVPILSWLCPGIGHTGITSSRGTTYDYAPYGNRVFINEWAFGSPDRYVQLDTANQIDDRKWDEWLESNAKKFTEIRFNIVTKNCHHFVLPPLNRLDLGQVEENDMNKAKKYNCAPLCCMICEKGKFTTRKSMLKSVVPSVCIYSTCFVVVLLLIIALVVVLIVLGVKGII